MDSLDTDTTRWASQEACRTTLSPFRERYIIVTIFLFIIFDPCVLMHNNSLSQNIVSLIIIVYINLHYLFTDDKICPSSIAAYFNGKGYTVNLCSPRVSDAKDFNIKVPSFDSTENEEILEWLGAYSLGINCRSGNIICICIYKLFLCVCVCVCCLLYTSRCV